MDSQFVYRVRSERSEYRSGVEISLARISEQFSARSTTDQDFDISVLRTPLVHLNCARSWHKCGIMEGYWPKRW